MISNLPTKGSEDVSYLLKEGMEHEIIKKVGNVVVREPSEDMYWLIDVEFINFTMTDEDIINILKGYIVYGHVKELDIWTGVGRRKEGSCIYDKISICVDIYDNVDYEPHVEYEEFKSHVDNIEKIFNTIGSTKIAPRESIDYGMKKAKRLNEFYTNEESFHHEIVLKLVAEDGQCYEGEHIWDVMLCLGIKWGDMDIFHAKNECLYGDDHLFSIYTNSGNGFFWLPTLMEDEFYDLVFTMNVARTHNPLETFNRMWMAAEYIKDRLGGGLVNEDNVVISKDSYIETINETVNRFKEYGVKPGQDVVLFLF